MTIQYHPHGEPAAEIAESIEHGIREGALASGDPLPAIRQLANELGVSPGTVAASYRLLGIRGLTASDRRRGTWVRELRKEDGALARRVISVPAGVTDCSTGNPDPALLPDPLALLASLPYRPGSYGSPTCDDALMTETRRRFASEGVPAEHSTCSFGALDAIGRILSSNLAPGDRVAVEDPGWAALIDVVERLGFLTIPLPLDSSGPTTDGVWQALAAGARAIVVTARAQNPTGAAVSPTRADELRALLSRYPGRLVIEDDHACGLVEVPLAPVVGTTGRYGFVRSVAKGYGPDLRLAVVAGDTATISRLEQSISMGAGWVSHLIQQLVLALWNDPGVADQLELASRTYRERRSALCAQLGERGIDVTAPTGLNVWVPVGDEATAVSALLANGWLVAPGNRFRIRSAPAIRVTTSALPVERAAELAGAIATARASAGARGRRADSGG